MKSNVILRGIIAFIIFLIVIIQFGGILWDFASFQDLSFVCIASSLLFGTIVACTTLIINYINKLREEVYQLKRQNEIFESKYFKQLENEKRV